MTIRDRVRSAIPRIVDALALVAMALRAPTAPLARFANREYQMNTPQWSNDCAANPIGRAGVKANPYLA